ADLDKLTESEAAHAARYMACLSTLTVLREDMSQLKVTDTFINAEGHEVPTGLANAVASAIKEGLEEDEVHAILNDIHASPVFTAHPTEMRRASVAEREYELVQLMQAWEKADTVEREALLDDIYRAV